jgi:hypothetical protein
VNDSERDRKLQRGDDVNVFADFTLTTSLKIPSSDDGTGAPALLFVGLALLVVSLVGCCCIIRRFGCLQAEVTGKTEVVPDLESTSNDEDHTEFSMRENDDRIPSSNTVSSPSMPSIK